MAAAEEGFHRDEAIDNESRSFVNSKFGTALLVAHQRDTGASVLLMGIPSKLNPYEISMEARCFLETWGK